MFLYQTNYLAEMLKKLKKYDLEFVFIIIHQLFTN